jgi:hypothetical protein
MRTGRPRALTREEHVELVRRWDEDGASASQLAAQFNIARSTVYEYLGKAAFATKHRRADDEPRAARPVREYDISSQVFGKHQAHADAIAAAKKRPTFTTRSRRARRNPSD